MRINRRKFIPKIQKPNGPKLRLPQIHLPEFQWPKMRLPNIKAPKVQWPNINVIIAKQLYALRNKIHTLKPNITLKKPNLPAFTIPRVNLSRLPRLPNIKKPQFNIPPVAAKLKDAMLITCLAITALALVLFTGSINLIPSNADASQFGFLKENTKLQNANFIPINAAQSLNTIETAAGESEDAIKYDFTTTPDDAALNDGYKYQIEENELNVESVLIPHANTVISSSRDGKIKSIDFDNGQLFKKGDTLVEYACEDARAEVAIAKTQKNLAEKKKSASYKLFKLDIISDIERMELETETDQAIARATLQESRLKDCFIRAQYDGRVVKKLANPGEFTRTDRVLMEVASLDTLKAEFLLPSRALRWINIGAPITITINETEETYPAKISHIYGEVDPISQSIQITAQLDDYKARLLPGMSGTATLNIEQIRRAGIVGFLEAKPTK